MEKMTSVQVLKEQKKRMDELKMANEPYYVVVEKLLDSYEREEKEND